MSSTLGRRKSMARRASVRIAPSVDTSDTVQKGSKPLGLENSNRVRTVALFSPGDSTRSASAGRSPSSSGGVWWDSISSPNSVTVTTKAAKARYEFDVVAPLSASALLTAYNEPIPSNVRKLLAELSAEVVDGSNGALLGYCTSLKCEGTLFGSLGSTLCTPLASVVVAELFGSIAARSVMDSECSSPTARQHTRSLETSRTVSEHTLSRAGASGDTVISATVFSMLSDGRLCDLTPSAEEAGRTADVGDHRRVPILAHAITGPKLHGFRVAQIDSSEEYERLMATAVTTLEMMDIPKKQHQCLGLILWHTNTRPTESVDGREVCTTVMSSLPIVDCGPDKGAALSKALDMTAVSEWQQLLSTAIGGNCFTAAVCCTAEDEEPAALSLALSNLQRLSHSSSSVRKRGSVREFLHDVTQQIIALRTKLEGSAPPLDATARRRLEKDITLKECHLRELLECASALPSSNAHLAAQVQKLTQTQKAHEAAADRALGELSIEKRRRFAQAFRMAFYKQKAVALSTAQMQTLQSAAADAQSVVTKLQQERDAYKEERDNLRAYRARSDEEREQERQHRVTLELDVSKWRRLHADLELQVLQLQRKLQQCEAAAVSGPAQLTMSLAHARAEVSRLTAANADLVSELQHVQYASRKKELEDELAVASAAASAERDVAKAQVECTVLRESLAYRDDTIRMLEERLLASQMRVEELQTKYLAEVKRSDSLSHAIHTRVQALRTKYSIERDAYLEMLHEGQCYVDEIHHFRRMQFTDLPSAYRGGRKEVELWLSALGNGIETLSSTLFANGFDTMHSLSLITEADLVKMNVTAGTRRKLLFALKEVAEGFKRSVTDSVSLFRQPVCLAQTDVLQASSGSELRSQLWANDDINDHLAMSISMDSLVSDLEAWISDFRSAIAAEHEMSSKFAEEMLQSTSRKDEQTNNVSL